MAFAGDPAGVAGVAAHPFRASSMSAEKTPDRPVKLACRQFWKLYGARAQRKFRAASELRELVESGRAFGALQDVELEIAEGEIFVVMGLSGSGKSTLLRCLSRLIEPSFGEVYLDGRPLTGLSAAELMKVRRHEVGMVFQHFALLPHMTVIDNVGFGLRIAGIGRKERRERAAKALELVGLSGWDNRKPSNLSGGMRQRVGLARALVMDTPVLLMDEPFSALDPLIREEMQQELLRLQSSLNKTIVFVTHDPNEAATIGDRIAILLKGQVVQEGRPTDIVLSPASDYVRDFVRGIDVFKVLSAGQVMDTVGPTVELANKPISQWTKHLSKDIVKLAPDDLIVPHLDELAKGRHALVVIQSDGTPLGTITAKSVLGALAAHSSLAGAAPRIEKLKAAEAKKADSAVERVTH